MSVKLVAFFILSSATVLASSEALAWGNEGHEIVALIAHDYLAPSVRAQVDYLLSLDQDALIAPDMASRATWADAWRQVHPETSSWHYVDLELSAPNLDQACRGDRSCVVRRVDRFAAELGTRSTSERERILALKMVLHLIGDIHQPLHAADNHDRAGNCERVSYSRPGLFGWRKFWGSQAEVTSLHSYWDTAAVQALGLDPFAVAQSLRREITREEVLTWSAGRPTDWAFQSFDVARDQVYGFGGPAGCGRRLVTALSGAYEAAAQRTVKIQLRRAGVRLATELNRALSLPAAMRP